MATQTTQERITTATSEVARIRAEIATKDAEAAEVKKMLERFDALEELTQADFLDMENHRRRHQRLVRESSDFARSLDPLEDELRAATQLAQEEAAAAARARLIEDEADLVGWFSKLQREVQSRLLAHVELRDAAAQASREASPDERRPDHTFGTSITRTLHKAKLEREPLEHAAEVLKARGDVPFLRPAPQA